MAIHKEVESTMQGGMNKGIDPGALQLIMDNLQKYQYVNPIKSAVRELISNALDSVSERDVARKILSGTHKVEDFYEDREGEIYKDSHFTPSYFDLNWLSKDKKVHMTYIAGNAIEKDKVEFRDNGVGLGGERLIKYFSLGYSTKRLSKLPLGKFGIGGKSPLSTGVDFFTMESRYNGKKFRFNVYSNNVDSIMPVSAHWIDVPQDGGEPFKVYYEPTTELNGVTVSFTVKKNHKTQYIDAVKSQLLYFDNIDFNILHDDGGLERIEYQTEILYEDDLIVLSDNNYWSKPHVLLNKVNYGYINFEELELEDKVGNIGIKIAPEEVDVNPSRESVIWSERTKAMVLGRFESVVGIATKLLQKELRETDYLKWLRTCYAMSNRFFAGDSITSRLAKIVDLTQIKPAFLPNPTLKFSSASNLGGLAIRTASISKEIVANRTKTKIVRKEFKNIQTVIERPIYLMKKNERASNRKDKWLFHNHGIDLFVTIQEPMTKEEMLEAGLSMEMIDFLSSHANKTAGIENATNNRYETWEALTKSADALLYSDVVVPEDFKSSDDEIVEEEIPKVQTVEQKEDAAVVRISEKERRLAEGKILIYTPRGTENSMVPMYDPNDPPKQSYYQNNPAYDPALSNTYGSLLNPGTNDRQWYIDAHPGTQIGQKAYEFQRIEIPIASMNDWDAEEVYYSDGDDELMNLVAMISRDPHPLNEIGSAKRLSGFRENNQSHNYGGWCSSKWFKLNSSKLYGVPDYFAYRCQHFFDNKEIKLIKTAKTNLKYFQDFRSIDKFFLTTQNNIITMSNLLIRWNTARLIKERMDKFRFLTRFDRFNQKYAEMHLQLLIYVDANYREMNPQANTYGFSSSTYTDMIEHLNKVQEFQEYVAKGPDAAELKAMAVYMFGNEKLQNGMAVDPEMMRILAQVQEFANGCGTLLNYIPNLTGDSNVNTISNELEIEIKQYLDYKGMLNFKTEEELKLEELSSLSPELHEFNPTHNNDDQIEEPELEEEGILNQFN